MADTNGDARNLDLELPDAAAAPASDAAPVAAPAPDAPTAPSEAAPVEAASATPAPDAPVEPDVAQLVARLRDDLKVALREPDRARKALDALAKPGALGRVDAVDKARKALQRVSLGVFAPGDGPTGEGPGSGLEEQRAALVDALGQHLGALRRKARGALLRDLDARARAQGIAPQVLTDKPLEVLLSPLTVELDLAAGEARIRYARETVVTCRPEPAAILRAWADAKARIKAEAVEPARFFDLLRQAYEIVRRARGLGPGERVDLVDLTGPLALLRVGPDAWRKTPLGKVADFPRYLLAYQLVHLRRAGLLSRHGVRVDLGTATGGSTRDKRGVLFLPSSATEGQYHLSIRFVPAAS